MGDNHNVGDSAYESLGDDAFSRTIDKLRELGIADLVPLPQLVMVGDQSSGKSSVLESVTGFAFPRAPELCTRYATQITCRRDDFESANEAMGLRGVNDGDGSKLSTFAEDILEIEINGPDQHHLTVIDVPGIFRTSTKGLTTDNDIVIVRNMVNRYIKDQRTIILAVIPCNVDIATQEVLTLAEEVDPEGLRTMGVLTKPDLATERATQQIVCELVEGERHSLRLGYCVVKNLSADNSTSTMTDRNSSEKAFFSASPWSRLRSTNRVGVGSLAIRLRDLLRDLSKKEFNNVKAEIQRMLDESETELKRMGPSRSRPDAQRRYLGRIASDFQEAALRARDGHYDGMDMFGQDVRFRLITRIVNLNETFNKVFTLYGHTLQFDGQDQEKVGPGSVLNLNMGPKSGRSVSDMLEHMDFQCPKPLDDSLLSRIEALFHRSRTAEIGSFPGSLLAQAFKEQTQKWEPLVLKYVSQAIVIVQEFILRTLRLKCTDRNTFEMLHDHLLLPKLRAAYQRALDHAHFLLEVELSGQPYTMNHYFNSNLQVSQTTRLQEAINKAVGPASVYNAHGTVARRAPGYLGANNNGNPFDFTTQQNTGSSGAAGWWVSKSTLSKLTTDRSNAEQVKEDVHDTLRSYYKVARKRFVDVVLQLVIFHFLLDSKTGPLKIFTPDLVMGLDDKQLQMIAGEDTATRVRREVLTRNVENLKPYVWRFPVPKNMICLVDMLSSSLLLLWWLWL
ncbi:interferon-induced GTP-binding protein Mx1 [Colletotrichum phormii]|uniref:Interferon-induced GTP-binding protein Mx1 n=1 Tax=Colletotrichum phormii TaxID=359342 RepID=A0AAJ0EDJ3_9PEZI|nr:interferon-induced GTP-binding protein Mx1 [Colletotrichum phormii]KAK1635079.1 interferon-induced GTP-binding protein Mx1 [Colletotrichum phormii]